VETVGIDRGQPTQMTTTTTERTASESQAQAGVDVGKAIAAGMAALRGDMITAIQAMKPAPVDFAPVIQAIAASKPAGGIDGTTGGLGGAAAGLGLLALREFMAKRKADADAEEGWRKAQEAHEREVALARQLPPPPVEKAA
jgi:hypothetical protein